MRTGEDNYMAAITLLLTRYQINNPLEGEIVEGADFWRIGLDIASIRCCQVRSFWLVRGRLIPGRVETSRQ